MIQTDRSTGDSVILMPLGKLIDIKNDLFNGLQRFTFAAINRIVQSLDRARVIEIRTIAIGNTQIGLLDAPEHLVVQRLLELLGVRHDGFGVVVLRIEVRDDGWIGLFAKPGVIINARIAVQR